MKINIGAYASYYMAKFSLDNEKEVIEFLNKHHLNYPNADKQPNAKVAQWD